MVNNLKNFSLKIWNKNAEFWDQHMQDGSDFQTHIVEPATLKLLGELKPGCKIIEIACGNGQFARKLKGLGAEVTAIDSSEEMIKHAKAREVHTIAYHVLDASSWQDMQILQESSFDKALCNMAFMDIADIKSVFSNVSNLLQVKGHFIVSQTHPCFEKGAGHLYFEVREKEGSILEESGVKVHHYLSASAQSVKALPQMAQQHYFFHRPLQDILSSAFHAGFILDGFEEVAFPKECKFKERKGWHLITEIPVIAVFRFQKI